METATDIISVVDWGRTEYDDALERQRQLVAKRRSDEIADTLIVTEHEPVVTAGSATEADEMPDRELLAANGVTFRQCSRGGKVTYHGPGQFVAYPILDLRRRQRDLHRYLADLESATINAIRACGVAAEKSDGRRGAYVGQRKIAAIGVAVRRWITYHGVAINVSCDLSPYNLIVPCGMPDVTATSLAQELSGPTKLAEMKQAFIESFRRVFVHETNTVEFALQGSNI